MQAVKNVRFRREWYEMIEQLPCDLKGSVMSAIFDYAFYGIKPKQSRVLDLLRVVFIEIDKQREGRQRQADGGRKSKRVKVKVEPQPEAVQEQPKVEEKSEPKTELVVVEEMPVSKMEKATITKRFIKPSVQEIKAYCFERGNGIDAERFWNYYESNGWKVGRNAMKDWRACIRTWEQKDKQQKQLTLTKAERNANAYERMYDEIMSNNYEITIKQ